MNWTNCRLVFRRELVDQMRDRRTLFTVFVMPLLLYPILGALMMQLASFFREHPTTVWVVGAENLPDAPPLLDAETVATGLASDAGRRLIRLQIDDSATGFLQRWAGVLEQEDVAGRQKLFAEMRKRGADLVAIVPRPMVMEHSRLLDEQPDVLLVFDSSNDNSRVAAQRWQFVMASWQQRLLTRLFHPQGSGEPGADDSASGENRAESSGSPVAGLTASLDLARPSSARAASWSRILPLLVMVWCLTGAFYPAIDLCAGEKERGTLETLLSSPASRSEIAIGKLGSVMVFSIATALLNLTSMGITAALFLSSSGFSGAAGMLQGPPTVSAIGLVVLATIPASALFGAFSLAAAAFARSSKEGQYYLIPLIMVTMPLMVIPMLPSVRLEMGTSLIPVTGVMLLFRNMIEGNWSQVLMYIGPVTVVCIACCTVAIRWVVYQFNSEEILFRPSERFAVGNWIRQMFRTRDVGPSVGHAVMCGVMILILKFGSGVFVSPSQDWNGFASQTFILLLVTICVPAMFMTVLLSSKPLKTLMLDRFSLTHAVLAVLLAICLNPLLGWFSGLVMRLYPVSDELTHMAAGLLGVVDSAPSLLAILFVFAVAPAIFEELAFRGFILNSFRSLSRPMVAVVLTSVLFGAAHGVIQQSIIAFVVGMVLGVIAIRTNSLLPCILFHATHNGLSVVLARWDQYGIAGIDWLIQRAPDGTWGFSPLTAGVMSLIAGLLLAWFLRPEWKPAGSVGNIVAGQPGIARRISLWLNSWFPSRQVSR